MLDWCKTVVRCSEGVTAGKEVEEHLEGRVWRPWEGEEWSLTAACALE